MASTTYQAVDKKQALWLVDQVFNLFRQYYGNSANNPPSEEAFSEFFNPSVKFVSNGQTVANGLEELTERTANQQQEYKKITFSKFSEEPIISGNKVILRFEADATPYNGPGLHAYVIAIFTLDGDKITQWTQVLHEKGTGEIDP
jgi:hypothetical protein